MTINENSIKQPKIGGNIVKRAKYKSATKTKPTKSLHMWCYYIFLIINLIS